MSNVLVVDEDPLQLELTARLLEREGHRVRVAADPGQALEVVEHEEPDVVILEPAMHGHDGHRVGQRIRQLRPRMPVLVVSERGDEELVVDSLRAFADDYLVKPVSPRLLLARVHVLLRRAVADHGARAADGSLVAGEISLTLQRHQVQVRSEPVHLTPREVRLLAVFMSNPNRVMSREELIALAWGEFDGGPKTVDTCIGRLRRKIEPRLSGDAFIEAVRGFGYRLTT